MLVIITQKHASSMANFHQPMRYAQIDGNYPQFRRRK